MSSSTSASGTVATRYATALLDIAEQGKCLDNVESDILDLRSMLSGSDDLDRVIRSSLVSREKQESFVMELAKKAKFQTITSNFLGLLAQNRRLSALSVIIDAFGNILSAHRGEVKAHVETAYALTKEQIKELTEKLSKSTGANVILDIEVNKDLLGGMVVTVGSRMIDDSVRSKLWRLEQSMKDQSNQNIKQNEVG